jgi:hypothetical protein
MSNPAVKIIQSVVIGGGAAAGGGAMTPLVVVAVVLVAVALLSSVLAVIVQALVLLVVLVAGAVVAGLVGRWVWWRHQYAARPLGGDGTVISRDPALVDQRVCGPCLQEMPKVKRAAVAVALNPGGAVAAVCAAHLAALHLAAAVTGQPAIPSQPGPAGAGVGARRWQR